MAQVTWRADDELVKRAKARARALDTSLNDFLTQLVNAATNPDFAGSRADRVRERLAAAGMLVEFSAPPGPPPSEEAVREAGRRAGRGKPVSEILLEDRGPR